MTLTRCTIGIVLGVLLSAGLGYAADPSEVESFVKARIEIGEMMTSYFQGGERFKEGQRPSPEQMKEMGADINAKLSMLLAKHHLSIDEYRKRSQDVFSDEASIKAFLNGHPDLKARYDALPLDRMGRGSSGRGY